MQNVLLVEDSVEVFNLVKRSLGSVKLDWAKSLQEANSLLQCKPFDLIILDVQLPDGDGYRQCSVLQTDDRLKTIPVMFLTGKTSISDKILGFSVGADDFLTKPFDPMELKARVDSKLRRRSRDRVVSDILRIGDLEINKSTHKVSISRPNQNEEVDLTPIEFKLLLLFAKDPTRVLSRDEILNTVWGESIHVYGRSVDTHVSKLRKKLGDKSDYIESVHGAGYRFREMTRDASRALEFGQPTVDATLQFGLQA